MRISYRFGSSWFHLLDPITKAVWCLIISVWLICLRQPIPVLCVCFGVLLVSIIGAGLNFKEYGKTLLVLSLSGVGLILFQGIFQPGPGPTIWFFHLSSYGLNLGTAIVLRLIGTIASALSFSTTTSPKDLSTAMLKLKIPYRIAHMVYLALRFIPLISSDLEYIRDIQHLRNVKKGVKSTLKALITLLATELRRVDDTVIALDTRAFGLYDHRTITKPIKIKTSGVILVIITLVAMVFQLVLLVR